MAKGIYPSFSDLPEVPWFNVWATAMGFRSCQRTLNYILRYCALLLQLGALDTLSVDISGVIRDDFDASIEANVTHLVTGWNPLMDSSLKGSAIINASATSSYEQLEVGFCIVGAEQWTTYLANRHVVIGRG